MKKTLNKNVALLLGLTIFICLTGVTGCNGEEQNCPLEVQIMPNPQYPTIVSSVKVFTIGEPVVVTAIKVNRGSIEVKPMHYNPMPHTLKPGTPMLAQVATPVSTVREVEVQTDKGNWTFTFK